MTNEQREAIEYLKESVLIYKNIIPKISDAIDTVLSLIKENQIETEIYKEELDSIYKALDIERGVARPSISEIIQALKNTIQSQAKQIDLMADFMYKTGTGRRALSCMFRQNDECSENGCNYCIKQYFAGLVEKE